MDVRTAEGRWCMSLMYVVAGLITLLLLVYLFVALLKPEKFG
jgi:K+-transporting ATPase KdpF subunit